LASVTVSNHVHVNGRRSKRGDKPGADNKPASVRFPSSARAFTKCAEYLIEELEKHDMTGSAKKNSSKKGDKVTKFRPYVWSNRKLKQRARDARGTKTKRKRKERGKRKRRINIQKRVQDPRPHEGSRGIQDHQRPHESRRKHHNKTGEGANPPNVKTVLPIAHEVGE